MASITSTHVVLVRVSITCTRQPQHMCSQWRCHRMASKTSRMSPQMKVQPAGCDNLNTRAPNKNATGWQPQHVFRMKVQLAGSDNLNTCVPSESENGWLRQPQHTLFRMKMQPAGSDNLNTSVPSESAIGWLRQPQRMCVDNLNTCDHDENANGSTTSTHVVLGQMQTTCIQQPRHM